MEKQYAREALVAKSQLRVKANKIGPRALGLGPHCIRKCPLKRKNVSARWAKARLCRLGKEGPHVLVEDHSCSWDLENENGQRARGRGSHSAGEMVLAKEKGRERKGLAGRGRRLIENSRLRTIKTYPLRFLQ